MKNKKFIVLLAALILLIALIFAVAYLAGRDSKPEVLSAPNSTKGVISVMGTEDAAASEPTNSDDASSSAKPQETALPEQTPSDTVPGKTNTPTSRPTSTPAPTAYISPVNGRAFTLTILGTNVPVSIGVDNETRDRTPGWLETSAYPSEEGVCVIYGHRNRNHLQVLKDIDYGDTITVTLADGTMLNYTVESIKILEPDEELRVPFISGQHLMLTTCYPFYYTGHAPQKFVLMAVKAD